MDILTDHMLQHVLRARHDLIEVQHLWFQYLAAAKRQQLLRQRRGPFTRRLNFLHVAALRVILSQVSQETLAVAHDDREHVVEVVRNTAREAPNGVQFLQLPELFLELSALGNMVDEVSFFLPQLAHRLSSLPVKDCQGQQDRDPKKVALGERTDLPHL